VLTWTSVDRYLRVLGPESESGNCCILMHVVEVEEAGFVKMGALMDVGMR